MLQGTVKLFLPRKDYGFIEPEDRSKDVYFHRSVLEPGADPVPGDAVEYELRPSTRIPQASRVRACKRAGA